MALREWLLLELTEFIPLEHKMNESVATLPRAHRLVVY